jgi:hypothetical protein
MASFSKKEISATTHSQSLKVQLDELEEQRELILWKYNTIPRDDINRLIKDNNLIISSFSSKL